MIYDLKNNIPFIYSEMDEEIPDDYGNFKPRIRNAKCIFYDSSRFLNPLRMSQLYYTEARKDVMYIYDIEKLNNTAQIIRDTSNFLDFLKDKYDGVSLFHHFASDQFIMNAIHEKYMLAKEKNRLDEDESLR